MNVCRSTAILRYGKLVVMCSITSILLLLVTVLGILRFNE